MKHIAPAKLTRPSSRGTLPRERLFHSIERGREKKVVWVSGPAGSGKTTLAASYLDFHKAPCLWYQLDEGDADLATFFYYLGLAAKHAAPRYRKPLPLLTPEYLLGVPVFAKRFFEQLSARLIGKTSRRDSPENGSSTFVLDNYQDVPEDSIFQEVINAGFSAIPEGLNVIILSRSEPPPAYARLRGAGEMSLLGWEDIRFTAEESNAIAMLKAGRDLPGDVLSQLYQTTDGWAAGLVLLMESLGTKDFDHKLLRGLGREDIFGYFATELFERGSPEDRVFLLETAFLPRMNARMAEELTGDARAGRIFSDLNRKNYFTNRYTSAEQAFQYHPLFREFLLAKAQETLPIERLVDIRSRAANVLEKNGYAEDAVSLFCEAGMWPEAVRAILTQAPMLTSQGRWQTLQGWIESLPKTVIEHQPWLLYWMGVSMLPISPDTSKDYFGRALEKFRIGRDAAGSFLALSGMLDSVTLKADTYLEMDSLIPLADELLEEHRRQFPSPEIEARMTASMLYALVMRQYDNPSWGYWEDRCIALARDVEDRHTAFRMLIALAFYRMSIGEIEKAKFILDPLHKQIEAGHKRTDAGGYAPLSVIVLRLIQAYCHWLSADFDKNRWAVADGIAMLDSTGIRLYEAGFYGYGAAGALSIGEIDRAEELLQTMLPCFGIMPSAHGESFYHLLMAWSSLLRDRLARASMHADKAIELGTAVANPLQQPYPHLIKAMVMHELRDDREAYLHLSEVRKFFSTIQLYQAEYMTLMVEAQIAIDHGDEAAGTDLLRKAMTIGREHGYANGFFWVNSMVAGLCVKALEAGIETDYVQGLIRKRNLVPDMPVLHLENWPWPLKIFTLGQFEMMRDGEVVKFTGKVQQKPLLLLKALIAFGGRDVKEEQLCDALWPDAEGDLAHRSFETTLYRLRQLIGKDKAIQLKEGRLTLDRQSCWVDAFALEQVLNEAEGLWEIRRRHQADPQRLRDATERAIQLTQRAIDLYRGHFLEVEPEQTWLFSPQERLRAKYIGGIESLAGHWETAGELEMAIRCYEKALEVDDLVEEFYQRLMICHQQQGRRSKALAVYSRCRSVLEARLGIEPSARTEALLDTLRSGR
jgi:LuxR family transcriptional regulator, maltose regulon positive regulatory protein